MKENKNIVISLGGSLIVPNEIDVSFLKEFISTIQEYISKGFKFFIITGGGNLARRYQKALTELDSPDSVSLDWLGIHTTRLNAEFVLLAFGQDAHGDIVTDPNIIPLTDKPIVIGAGWKPGWSTDYDAVLIAKNIGAKHVVNLSNIEYAYDKDPRVYADAKPIEKISWAEFRALLPTEWDPGLNAPFDPIAAKEADESQIEVAIMNGKNIPNLKNYLDGNEFVGTVIR